MTGSELFGKTGTAPPRLVATARLVEREPQLRQLTHLLALAQDGRGQVAFIRGEAGIGKTSLLGEVVARATGKGFAVRAGEGREPEQTRPFGPICDAFGVSLGAADANLAQLARRVHGHRAWSSSLEEVPVEVHYLVESMVELFEALCSTGPALLVVENVHWADSSTVTLLRRIAHLCPQYPALVVVSTRPTDRPDVEGLGGLATKAGATVIDLGPLSSASACSLAGQIVGGPPGQALAQLIDKAEGNPLFVVELASVLVQRGLVSLSPTGEAELGEVASSVGLSATILNRFSMLPAETVELLRTAAVLGRSFDVRELALLTRRSALDLAGPLRAATRSGLIEADGDQLAFRHDLLHDALYYDWPLSVRKALHRQLGKLLAKSDAPTYRVAHHLALGAESGDGEAVRWLHRAGLGDS